MQQWRPPARTTIVSRTVGGLGSEGDKSASAPWLKHCRSQCNIRLAAEIDIVIFEWQQEGVGKQRLSNSCLKTGAGKAEVEQ